MKPASLTLSAAAVALLSAALAVTALAQAPATPPQPAGTPPPEHHEFPPMPPPKNLQVLPKTLTADQVHDIMHGWEAALGTNCSHCHAADPSKIAPNGRPRLDFAADTKPEKATARLMVKMVEDINTNYISMVEKPGTPAEKSSAMVTCGTCHRGHVAPEPFVAPPDEDHDHHGPPPADGKPPLPR